MGSGDPSGLQNRRELASLALVSSTLTRFRQSLLTGNKTAAPERRGREAIKQNGKTDPSPSASSGSGFRLRAPASLTPANRLNLKAAYGQPASGVCAGWDGYKHDRRDARRRRRNRAFK